MSRVAFVDVVHSDARLAHETALGLCHSVTTWPLETKYYRVTLQLETHSHLEELCEGSSEAAATEETQLVPSKDVATNTYPWREAEAVVVVFNAEQPDTVARAKHAWTVAASHTTAPSIGVLLDFSKSSGHQQDVREFCIANNIELVCMTPGDDVANDDEEVDENDYGLKRLRAALEAHMWPGLELLSSSASRGKTAKTATQEDDQSSNRKGAAVDAQTLTADSKAAAHKAAAAPQSSSGLVDMQRLHQSLDVMCSIDENNVDDGALEAHDEAFSYLVQQMTRLRNAAGSLPEDQRKDAAAQIALALASKLMGEEIDGSDDDDDS